MNASNSRVRSIELLKFIGILLIGFVLIGFSFFGGENVQKKEIDILKEEVSMLTAELENYRLQEKRLSATLLWADTIYSQLSYMSNLENQVPSLLGQGPAGEVQIITINGQINALTGNIQQFLFNLNNAQKDTSRSYKLGKLVEAYNQRFMEVYNLTMSDKRLKRAALGNIDPKDSQIKNLEQQLADQNQQLQNAQIQNQFKNQISGLEGNNASLQTKISQLSGDLSDCMAGKVTLESQLSQSKQLLASKHPILSNISQSLLTESANLQTIQSQVRGWGDKEDKQQISVIISKINNISRNLSGTSSEMSGLVAKLP